jgi:hypothetical protein
MTRHQFSPEYQEIYEYHGNTAIEYTRCQGGRTILQEWILFDSVEEAIEFFNSRGV